MGSYRFLSGEVVPLPADAALPEFHTPWCYGCGPKNDQALGMRFGLDGDRVVSELDFAPWFQGGPGTVHGGATAAFFDDLMGTVLMAHLKPSVTAKLEVNYLRPIPLGVRIRGEAWLAGEDGRKLWVEAEGVDDREQRYVEARGLFLQIGLDHWSKVAEAVPEETRRRMARYQEGEYYP